MNSYCLQLVTASIVLSFAISSAALPAPSKTLLKTIGRDYIEQADTVDLASSGEADKMDLVSSGEADKMNLADTLCNTQALTDVLANQLPVIGETTCLEKLLFDDCCQPAWLQLKTSGIYPLTATLNNLAYCDMERHGGGWTVLLRRYSGKKSFDLDWRHYERGFGKLDKEFWIGLIAMHRLSSLPGGLEMRIDLKHESGSNYFVRYDHFHVAGKETNYMLTVSGYDNSSNLTDGFAYSSGAPFSTPERDNDGDPQRNWGQLSKGGWWFKKGFRGGNLNYQWSNERLRKPGINWQLGNRVLYFNSGEMKVRPKAWHCGNIKLPSKLQTDIAFLQHQYPRVIGKDKGSGRVLTKG